MDFHLFREKISSFRMIIFGFLGLILAGTILLMLPVSVKDGHGAPFEDALFTATSAVCVTGLITRDTALYWSGFGQAVILMAAALTQKTLEKTKEAISPTKAVEVGFSSSLIRILISSMKNPAAGPKAKAPIRSTVTITATRMRPLLFPASRFEQMASAAKPALS